MKRMCSAALVVVALGTSAWADESALVASNFVDCEEATFVAQFVQADLTEAQPVPSRVHAQQVEDDRIAAIVDQIAQNTFVIGTSSPPILIEGSLDIAAIAEDATETTGSIRSVDLAPDGLEDR